MAQERHGRTMSRDSDKVKGRYVHRVRWRTTWTHIQVQYTPLRDRIYLLDSMVRGI